MRGPVGAFVCGARGPTPPPSPGTRARDPGTLSPPTPRPVPGRGPPTPPASPPPSAHRPGRERRPDLGAGPGPALRGAGRRLLRGTGAGSLHLVSPAPLHLALPTSTPSPVPERPLAEAGPGRRGAGAPRSGGSALGGWGPGSQLSCWWGRADGGGGGGGAGSPQLPGPGGGRLRLRLQPAPGRRARSCPGRLQKGVSRASEPTFLGQVWGGGGKSSRELLAGLGMGRASSCPGCGHGCEAGRPCRLTLHSPGPWPLRGDGSGGGAAPEGSAWPGSGHPALPVPRAHSEPTAKRDQGVSGTAPGRGPAPTALPPSAQEPGVGTGWCLGPRCAWPWWPPGPP